MFIFTAVFLAWGGMVYFLFKNSVRAALLPAVSRTQDNLAQQMRSQSVRNTKEHFKLAFTELERNDEVVFFSFLNEDKNLNYVEGLRKRKHILWALNVEYPVKTDDKIVGWIKIWPSPEMSLKAFFSDKNVLIIALSFFLAGMLVFAVTAVYVTVQLLRPLYEFREAVRNLSGSGNTAEVKFKHKTGLWKDMADYLKRLNSRVVDINTTVQMLFSVSKTLTSQVDMNHIFNVVLGIIQKKFPDAMCAVVLPGEDGSLKVAAKRGYSQNFARSLKMEIGNPVSEAIILCKMSAIKDLNSFDERLVKDFLSEGAVTQINIPLLDENNSCMGVLNVSGKSNDIFDSDIADTISTVGKYLSIAMRNAKMYDKVQELNRRLETEVNITSNELLQTNARLIRKVRDIKALSDISAFASAKFDLTAITAFVIQKITEITGMETSAVMVKNAAGKYVFLKGSFSIDPAALDEQRFDSGNCGIIGEIEKERRSVILPKAADVKQKAAEFDALLPITSAAFVPIENNGNIDGIIISVNKFGSEILESDLNIIEHIAVLFSGILEKIKLYSKLEKKISELTFMQKISSTVSMAPNLEKTLAAITDVTKDAFRADLCAILLYDSASSQLVTQPGAFFTGGSDKVMLRIHKDDDRYISAKIFRDGIAYLSDNAMTDPSINNQKTKEWGIDSIIAVPLINDEKPIGVLMVGRHEHGVYGEEDKNLVVMISNHAAVLIENANLYDALSTCKVQ